MVKKKSRASASRAKGAKKSAVKRAKSPARVTSAAPKRQGLDVKKLKEDLGKAIKHLDDRIGKRGPEMGLSDTRDAFARWIMEIDTTVCVGASGPCGDDMFIGS